MGALASGSVWIIISGLGLGHFQVGSYRYRSLIQRSIYLIEALWKPYIP